MTMHPTIEAAPGWRRATQGDLPAIARLADAIHPAHPESPLVFADRLALRAAWVTLAGCGGDPVGYAIGHPWAGAPPTLDRRLGCLPASPDRYWIHDLALAPGARGLGLGQAGARLLLRDAAGLGLARVSLVALGDAARFWRRVGFAPDPAMIVPACYGAGALGMRLDVARGDA